MKPLAFIAALALIPTGALALSLPQHHLNSGAPLGERAILANASPLHLRPWMAGNLSPLQTGATSTATTATATPVPTGTAVPVPTGTAAGTPNTYPDPVTLLGDSGLVFQQIRTAHFELQTDGDQTGIEKLQIDITGDVTCKGPSLKGHLLATDTLEATSQVKKLNVSFILIKKKAFEKSKSTKGRWKKGVYKSYTDLGASADNLLLCPSTASSSGSGSSSSSQLKNLVDLGPSTFQGVSVWHIQGTEVGTDASGQPVSGTLDLYISQDHYLPYLSTYTQNTNGVALVQKEIMTKFGEKLKIRAPKIGSKTP